MAEPTTGAVGLGLGNLPRIDEAAENERSEIDDGGKREREVRRLQGVLVIGFGLRNPFDVAAIGPFDRSKSRRGLCAEMTLAD